MKKYVALSGAIVVVLALAVYFGQDALSQGQPDWERKPEDPCYGKTDEECMALISQKRADMEPKEAAWIEEAQKGLDLRSLPRTGLGVHSNLLDLPATLQLAVARANLIVLARSETVHFIPFTNADVTLTVERVLKGPPVGGSLTIIQGGRLIPKYNDSVDPKDWKVKELGYSEGGPLLLPGDRAVLFLEQRSSGKYGIQLFTGQYAVGADDKLQALPGNPFASAADRKPLDQFLAAVTQALAQPAAP